MKYILPASGLIVAWRIEPTLVTGTGRVLPVFPSST